MDELRGFLNSMTLAGQSDFAHRCGTSLAYLRKAISRDQQFGARLSVLIEQESRGAVNRKHLHPSDWKCLWPELNAKAVAYYCCLTAQLSEVVPEGKEK